VWGRFEGHTWAHFECKEGLRATHGPILCVALILLQDSYRVG